MSKKKRKIILLAAEVVLLFVGAVYAALLLTSTTKNDGEELSFEGAYICWSEDTKSIGEEFTYESLDGEESVEESYGIGSQFSFGRDGTFSILTNDGKKTSGTFRFAEDSSDETVKLVAYRDKVILDDEHLEAEEGQTSEITIKIDAEGVASIQESADGEVLSCR